MAIVIKNGLKDHSINFGSDQMGSGTLKPGQTQSLTGAGPVGWQIVSETSLCGFSSFAAQEGFEYVIEVTARQL
jgi:hypothetical protein